MAWNLAEMHKIETDDLRKSVLDMLLMESNLLEIIPWETTGRLSQTLVRYRDLPTVGYRKVNKAYAESTGSFEHKVESVALGGLDIDTDIVIARNANTIEDARTIQQKMALKAMAYQFNWKFIAGSPVNNPEEFKGLEERVDDVFAENFTNQLFACSTGATGILNSTTTRFNFIQDLDKLIYSIIGHNPDALFMNKRMLLAIRSALLREKLLTYGQDMFGRQIDMYGNTRLIDIGVRADQTTEIILNDENATGGLADSGVYSSIYACKFGIGDAFWGQQMYPLEVRDLGELQTLPVFRTRVDWPHGLADIDPRSIARMYGIISTS